MNSRLYSSCIVVDCEDTAKGQYGITQQGKITLIFRGYEYYKHRTTTTSETVWRCKNYKTKCRATVKAVGLKVIDSHKLHNHEENVTKLKISKRDTNE